MTPQWYADCYLRLNFTYCDKTYSTPIDRYLAMKAAICDASKINGSKKAKGWLMEAANECAKKGSVKKLKNAFEATAPNGEVQYIPEESINKAFWGKGAPSDYEKTLWLAMHTGQITGDKTKTSSTCCLPNDYAKWYLGTDCSGFAMNYLGIQSYIEDLDKGKTEQRRKSFNEIRVGDAQVHNVLGEGYHHIALVTGVEIKGQSAIVHTVESYGWHLVGISHHTHQFMVKSTGVFQEVKHGQKQTTYECYFHPVPQRHGSNL